MNNSLLNIIISFLLLLGEVNFEAQSKCKCIVNIDSLFQTHFLSLDATIRDDSVKKFVQPNDIKFVYLISFLSGINYEMHSYTGQPQLNYKKVIEYKVWYKKNRGKIKCKTIQRGLFLLGQNVITEEIIEELSKLKIE